MPAASPDVGRQGRLRWPTGRGTAAEEAAPRRSELRRSGDYSGPSSFLGVVLGPRSQAVVVPRWCRTPAVRSHAVDDLLRRPRPDAARRRSRVTPHRSRSSRARARARPASSPAASRGRRARARSTRATCSRSRSPARPRASSRPRLARLGVAAARHRGHVPRRSRSRSSGAGGRRSAQPMPALLERKVRVARARCCRRHAGARRRSSPRELACEIEWAKARLVRPDGYEDAVAAAARTPPRPAAEVAAVYRAYERAEAATRARRLRRPHLVVRRRARTRRRVRRRAAVAVPPPLRRRVPGRDARRSSGSSGRGSVTAPTSASSATPTRRSTGSPAPIPAYLGGFARSLPARAVPDAGVVRLGRNYRSTPQIVAAARAVLGSPAPPRHRPRRRDPTARCPRSPPTTPTTTRRAAWRDALRAAHGPRRSAGRVSRCSTASTRSRRRSRRR